MARIRKPGRPRKFTAKQLARECEAYFRSISYEEPVLQKVPVLREDGTPVLDDWGHAAYRMEPVVLANGNEARITKWIEPPGIMALCLYLGIDESTFLRYGSMDPAQDPEAEEFCRTVSRARGRVKAYLVAQTENGKAARGAIWNLQQNFGERERREISLDEETRKAISANGMTMAEKLELLQSIGDLPEADGVDQ